MVGTQSESTGPLDWGFTPPPPPARLGAPARPSTTAPTDVATGGGEPGGARGAERLHPGGRRGLVAALVVTALVSGGAGAAIAVAVDNHRAPASSQGVLPTAAPGRPGAVTSNGSGLDVQAVALRVEAATVDITATSPGSEGSGTGMVLTPSGVVLTNNHVVAGSTELSAQVDGQGRSYTASVIGVDIAQDVALLQLHGWAHFKTVVIGNSSNVAVGDQVLAIGDALALPGPETVTTGDISAVHRAISISNPSAGTVEELSDMFQISAPISSGNSGGPLVDTAGQVIAMNTVAAGTDGDGETASNVGFAIPINVAMPIARQIESGRATAAVQIGPRAVTGFGVTSVACADGLDGCLPLGFGFGQVPAFGNFGFYQAPVDQGAVVDEVEAGSPAAAAGLQVGDVVVSCNGRTVSSPDQLDNLVNGLKVGQKTTVRWVGQDGVHQSATFALVAGPNL